jgi:hypothetical protein
MRKYVFTESVRYLRERNREGEMFVNDKVIYLRFGQLVEMKEPKSQMADKAKIGGV